jgi:hypothetical protein
MCLAESCGCFKKNQSAARHIGTQSQLAALDTGSINIQR